MQISLSRPDITQAERDAVLEVLQTPNLSLGPKLPEFERVFAAFVGSRNAVAVNSGTSALHLCMRAIGLQPGDEVITTPFSFIASSNCILFEGGVPVFVDIDPDTWNINPDLIEAAITPRTRAILPVDVFGQMADMPRIRQIAQKHGLRVIEDSCEALGATLNGQKAGTYGDAGVFGFYPNKQITTGEGGMIVTNDDEAAALMRALRNQGRAPGDNWLQHTELGYNYRIDEMSAALGLAQMQRVEELIDKRQRVADWYAERLPEIAGIEMPGVAVETTRFSWFVYVIRVKAGIERDKLAARLSDAGIPVRPYFLPIHLQPYMVKQFGYQEGDYPITEDLGKRGLALPFSGVMSEEQVDLVCQTLRQCLAD